MVLDASAAVELLVGTRRGASVAARASGPGVTLHAPHLLDLEVISALRVLEGKKVLSAAVTTAAVVALRAVHLDRYPHEPLLSRIWQLRGNMTPYDAAYVALAEYLGAALVTCDKRLAIAPGHRARIELVA